MKWKGFRDERATILLDLTKNQEELWNNIDKDAKWGIKKAEKEGLVVKESEEETELKKFYEIYKETCIFGGITPLNLEKIKKMNAKFFFCYKDGLLIAGNAIIIENNDKFRLFLNASSHEYLKFQPNNILYYALIKWGKGKGYKVFDLGGYQLKAKPGDKLYNINRFKERWGGKIEVYHVYSYNPFYILGRKTIKKSRTARWIWDRIKRRPLTIKKNERTEN